MNNIKENPYSLGYKYRDGTPRRDDDVYPAYDPNMFKQTKIKLEDNHQLHFEIASKLKEMYALSNKYGFCWTNFPHDVYVYEDLNTSAHVAVVDRFGKIRHMLCADYSKLQLTGA